MSLPELSEEQKENILKEWNDRPSDPPSLLELIKTNKEYVKDIWIYGNLSFKNKIDEISDLDLIVVYSKKPVKLSFPKEIKKKFTGRVIYIR